MLDLESNFALAAVNNPTNSTVGSRKYRKRYSKPPNRSRIESSTFTDFWLNRSKFKHIPIDRLYFESILEIIKYGSRTDGHIREHPVHQRKTPEKAFRIQFVLTDSDVYHYCKLIREQQTSVFIRRLLKLYFARDLIKKHTKNG